MKASGPSSKVAYADGTELWDVWYCVCVWWWFQIPRQIAHLEQGMKREKKRSDADVALTSAGIPTTTLLPNPSLPYPKSRILNLKPSI